MEHKSQTIVIFGSSKPKPGSQEYDLAYEVGHSLASSGYQIANGGYGGTMLASAKGAHDASGACTGVTCNAFGRGGPNEWITTEVRTETLTERLDKLIELGDAFIALPGSTGTLLELAACWELINKRFLPAMPIICITDFWHATVQAILDRGETKGQQVLFADHANHAVELLNKHFSNSAIDE